MKLAFPFKLIIAMALAAPLLASGSGTDPATESEASSATWLARMQQLAQQGDAEAQYSLGVMYAYGQGVPQDHAEAARWYRKAADQDLADAQNNLGLGYEKGQGVPQDHAEAMRWYRKAADQGHADAQHNLSVMYALGQGVPQDWVAAYALLNVASSKGDGNSTKARDLIANKLSPAQLRQAQSISQQIYDSGNLDTLDAWLKSK